MENRQDYEEDIAKLYEASRTGCVEALNQVMQMHPLILVKLSLTSTTETPLHISALLGHVEVTKILLANHPKLVEELDSPFRRLPLHLASAGGHEETVRVLLNAYPEGCLFRDQDGRTPLHYAVMRGRVEVSEQLVCAKPEAISVSDVNRSTVLHLCVEYNKLDCLKVLVGAIGDDNPWLNSRRSDGGMTILHLALMLRQVETMRYLLSLPVIRAEANSVNDQIALLLDVLEHSSISTRRDDLRNCLEIQQILIDTGIRRSQSNENINEQPPLPPVINRGVKKGSKAGWFGKLMDCFRYKNDNWLEETRGALMLVSSMISSMTFQAAINPPSPGIGWQQGESVKGLWEIYFTLFIITNSISFLASLTVTLLLVSGFPLNHRLSMWILAMALCVTLIITARAYLWSMILVMPAGRYFDATQVVSPVWTQIWFLLIAAIAGMFHILRFLIWYIRKLRHNKLLNHLMSIVSVRNVPDSISTNLTAATDSGGHV